MFWRFFDGSDSSVGFPIDTGRAPLSAAEKSRQIVGVTELIPRGDFFDAEICSDQFLAESYNALTAATYYKDVIIPAMEALRAVVDQMEVDTSAHSWPYPSYGEMLYSVM